MRVVCIRDDWQLVHGNAISKLPVCGNVYNVTGEDEAFGMKFYFLAEFGMAAFDQNDFIPAEETDAAIDQVNEVLLTTH